MGTRMPTKVCPTCGKKLSVFNRASDRACISCALKAARSWVPSQDERRYISKVRALMISLFVPLLMFFLVGECYGNALWSYSMSPSVAGGMVGLFFVLFGLQLVTVHRMTVAIKLRGSASLILLCLIPAVLPFVILGLSLESASVLNRPSGRSAVPDPDPADTRTWQCGCGKINSFSSEFCEAPSCGLAKPVGCTRI